MTSRADEPGGAISPADGATRPMGAAPRALDGTSLRTAGADVLAAIARYWESLRGPDAPPVLSRAVPGDVLRALPLHAPEEPEPGCGSPEAPADYARLLDDLDRVVLPGLTHWQHPGFFAFFPANISTPAVLGELLSAGLGVQGMLWQTSPACTELETRVLDWMAELLGLPASMMSSGGGGGGGVIHGTASEATLAALVAARHRVRAAHKAARRAGTPHLTVYASSQAHSSLVKAALIAGLADDPEDRTHVRLIATGPDHAMDPQALAAALREDLAAGRTPCMVHATVGTTGSTAFDPLDRIADAMVRTGAAEPAANTGAWLHADAAYAGAAMLCPEFRHLQRGVEHCDSYCFNPHKWLLTNFDCDCFYTRDRASLTESLSITPEYLRNPLSDSGGVIDYRDWQIPLGRRFRALKLWMVLRAYGASGLRAYIREHVRLARLLEGLIAADARFELAAPAPLNLLCFRVRPAPGAGADATRLNAALLARLNATGEIYLTHTVLPGGTYVLRLCVGTASTTEQDVRRAWMLIQREASALESGELLG